MKPAVLLFTTTHCPHCASIISAFEKLQQQNLVSRVEVINIEKQPEQAAEYNVRSVPWFRIGELEFTGKHTYSELSHWVQNAETDEGIRQYVIEQLESGQLSSVSSFLQRHPHLLVIAIPILADMQAPLQARIGISAVVESLEGEPLLEHIIPQLCKMSSSSNISIRSDACHLLGMIHHADAITCLHTCAEDPEPQVREIAREALEDHPLT